MKPKPDTVTIMTKKIGGLMLVAILAGSAVLAGCSEKKYTINGTVANADPEKFIVLERSDPGGSWITMDSVQLKDGSFTFSGEPSGNPEIFRLRMADQYIYFPVDSTENVEISAHANAFATDFSIKGSEDAAAMERLEKALIAFNAAPRTPEELAIFKRTVYTDYLQNAKGSIVSYYALTKTLNGKPLYDMAEDYKYFAAVATAFKQFRPDDPRTALLEKTGLEALRRHNESRGVKRVVEANEVKILDISLPDENGTTRSLSSEAGKGKPTVVIFANLTDQGAPELNMQLRKIHDSGCVNFYHVSFDQDRYQWRNGAANLPWTTVWAGDVTAASKVATDYNLNRTPVFFIYDAAGNLSSRADDLSSLSNNLSKY